MEAAAMDMEDIKDLVDGKGNLAALPSISDFMGGSDFLGAAVAKGILDSSPTFKLPPGVSTPMAPGVAHMIREGENGQYTMPNTEKNHISRVQRDAINAGVRSMRTLSGGNNLDPWGTRQTSQHHKFPTYGNYLKSMVDNFQIAPGFGIGAVPATVMKSTAFINPNMPFGPGPLGTGIDFFGLQNADRMSVSTKEGLNPLLPMAFKPTNFQLNDGHSGFSVPTSATQQLPKEAINLFPKTLEYAYGGVGGNPMTGMNPIFM